jgi:DNA-binding MarR family transcriptional regulator
MSLTSLINDILKGLPENSLLRAKAKDAATEIETLQAEVASLKDDKRDDAAKIANLQKQIDDLSHVDLDETDTRILLYVANAVYSAPWAEAVAEQMDIHPQIVHFRLNRLEDNHYIYGSHDINTGLRVYEMADKGRALLIEKNLIT